MKLEHNKYYKLNSLEEIFKINEKNGAFEARNLFSNDSFGIYRENGEKIVGIYEISQEYQENTITSISPDIMMKLFEYHENQFRKQSNIPYICHPIDVLNLLVKCGVNDINMQLGTLYHDVFEDYFMKDSNSSEENMISLKNGFYEVISIIGIEASLYALELTKMPGVDKKDYLNSFASKSSSSLLIKIIDRICNVKDFQVFDWRYSKKYFEEAECLFDLFLKREKEYDKRIFNNVCNLISKDAS